MLLRRYLYLRTVIILLLVSILAVPATLGSAQVAIEASFAREEVVVTPLGGLQVTRTIKLVNVNSTTMSSTAVLLPKGASDITAMDDMGSIPSKVAENETGKVVTVTFRYPLRSEVGGVAYKDVYTFSLRYSLGTSSYITQPEFGNFRLELNSTTGIEFPVTKYTMVVTLPEGSSFSSSQPTGNVTVTGLSPVASYSVIGLKPKEGFHVRVSYRFIPIWSALRPALWIGTITAITSAVLLLRRRLRRVEVREEGVDMGPIRNLANSLDEELGLWEDLDQLEEALDDGSIGRKDYNRRRRLLDERSRTLSASLSRLRQGVRQISARYARSVDQVEAAEREMATLRNDFQRLRSQFRAGRLSRSSFENLEESHRRRAGKVRATIGTIVIELRGELG